MAVLETIRVKLGILITVLIAVALLSFIIDPTTLQSVSSSMSSKYDVGEIDGKSISYNDFQADVEKFTAINEIVSGSTVHNEQQQIAVRNAAWQSLLDKYLFVKNAQAAGINVGDEEMVKLLSGEVDSPVFTQNPAFFDENGLFSKARVLEFVSYIESDQTGKLKIYWDYLQESARNQQYYKKYMALFTQSNVINPLMLTEKIAENNNTFDLAVPGRRHGRDRVWREVQSVGAGTDMSVESPFRWIGLLERRLRDFRFGEQRHGAHRDEGECHLWNIFLHGEHAPAPLRCPFRRWQDDQGRHPHALPRQSREHLDGRDGDWRHFGRPDEHPGAEDPGGFVSV